MSLSHNFKQENYSGEWIVVQRTSIIYLFIYLFIYSVIIDDVEEKVCIARYYIQ